ncbi:LysM peptidoglycan-binding domain-containing protein [Thermaerobacillus caldiproteolyticus]|uniref:LysM repeat protein n=1 Tax=Thermaerobacillus caldiproteolyticus TaxID=247480 RepID=A0A7V9Z3T5_9BACL|nr:LysM domain-containing protein [Anoxybacillus caldiproteolyticus]MBA2873496.1 LysM repeat protein [Anoxybacillus caldiproteolyticus]
MKKFVLFLVLCLCLYVVSHDLIKGTLPTTTKIKTLHIHEPKLRAKMNINYQTVTVKAGDTLLSIAEKQQNAPLPVSIEQLIKDFEALNPGTKANSLQIGKTYKIPIYKH